MKLAVESSLDNNLSNVVPAESWLKDRHTLLEANNGDWVKLDGGASHGSLNFLGPIVVVDELRYACEATKSYDCEKNAPKAYSALDNVLNVCETLDEGSACKIREAIESALNG